MDRTRPLFLNKSRCPIMLFDPRYSSIEQRLRRELAAWRGFAHAQSLLDGCGVLVFQPRGASGGAR
jgi:hypothetical protein